MILERFGEGGGSTSKTFKKKSVGGTFPFKKIDPKNKYSFVDLFLITTGEKKKKLFRDNRKAIFFKNFGKH